MRDLPESELRLGPLAVLKKLVTNDLRDGQIFTQKRGRPIRRAKKRAK